tara:strand:+ start:8298 stop:8444 length:147 start_codon:yes stop_codon:yes gene_type:complete
MTGNGTYYTLGCTGTLHQKKLVTVEEQTYLKEESEEKNRVLLKTGIEN